MQTVWIDIETRSQCDLPKHGVYRYAADPSTEILVIGYAMDDREVKTWLRGQPLPADLMSVLAKASPGVRLTAHNAAFERLVLGRQFPAVLDARRWNCTMAQGRAAALAGSLEDASRMLGTTLRKNQRGSALIRLLSVPREDGSFLEDPTLMAEFARYCADDVRVMRQLSKGLPPLTAEALALYAANEAVNDRGLPIDTELCTAALAYAEEAAREATARIQALTHGEVSSARSSKLAQWLYSRMREPYAHLMRVNRVDVAGVTKTQHGHRSGREDAQAGIRNAPGATQRQGLSLDRDVRASLLDAIDAEPDEFSVDVIAAIEAAEDAALSSVAKFGTMLDRVCSDGRLRGAFVMNGASQTGRFSSTGAQLHNFPRLVADDPDRLRAKVLRGDKLNGNTLTALKSLLRPAIRPPRGCIVRADWTAIEARGLPWLAGPAAAPYLTMWADAARDPYIEQARLAGLGPARQAGKVAVLSLGYGGGPAALMRMGKGYNVTIADPQQVVSNWRMANSWAVAWWQELEAAAYTALRKHDGEWVNAGRIGLAADAFGLAMKLPSGRQLRYPFAEFEWRREQYQSVITYRKAAWKPKADAVDAWPRATMWHGTLAENATQATCGDLLRQAIIGSVGDGLPLIGHVHDELIGEAPHARAAQDLARAFERRMLDLPQWASGLPLAVETDSAAYFRK